MVTQMQRLWRDESASVAIEYAILGTSLAVVIVTSVSGIAGKLIGYFSQVSGALN